MMIMPSLQEEDSSDDAAVPSDDEDNVPFPYLDRRTRDAQRAQRQPRPLTVAAQRETICTAVINNLTSASATAGVVKAAEAGDLAAPPVAPPSRPDGRKRDVTDREVRRRAIRHHNKWLLDNAVVEVTGRGTLRHPNIVDTQFHEGNGRRTIVFQPRKRARQ